MLRVFLSSTFRDLKDKRRKLLDQLDEALKDVGMEGFIPDGRTSQEIALENIWNSDVVIFLISPYYGTLIDECKIKNCKADCPMKDGSSRISYTHCEYKFALAENKLHQAYLVDKDWEITSKLKNWNEIDWETIHDDPILKVIPREELKHYFKVAKNVSKFKEEAESELCPRINGIDRIVSDLADNIVDWYSERRLNLEDFYGRRQDLKHLLEAMDESVEVYGVGGVGKTCMIQLALLIQKLKGKKIITISTGQSYFSGSGYKPFKDKCAEGLHEIIGNKITLDDVADALGIQEELKSKNAAEKIRIISDSIKKENIYLFIDDFHLSDEDVKQLVKYASSGLVLASKRKIGDARGEIHLSGIEKDDRYEFIGRSALRFDKKLDDKARSTICQIAEGHPVSTEILVRNYEKIDFDRLKSFKQSLESSNPDHAEELMRREVKEVLCEDAFSLLKKLALINTELENDIDLKIIAKIQGKGSEAVFHELIDTGMLSKKTTARAAYYFSYRHIQDAVKNDKKEYHKWAINYYSNKIRAYDKNYVDQIELLFHQSMSNPKEKQVVAFLDLCRSVGPGQFGFARLIEAGEQLRPSFNEDIQIYAKLIGSIAVLYHKLTRFDSAEELYKKSLKIYRPLAGRNPDGFNSYLAITLNNLANLYKDLRKFESAEEHYKEALNIYRALAERNPDGFNSDLAMTLNNLAILYSDLRKFESAEEHYKESLEIYRALAERNPNAFNSDLARTLNNLANLYNNLGKFEFAEEYCKEALRIRRALAERNPDAFNSDLATTLNNLASLYKDLRKFESAEEHYKEALRIGRALAERNPDAFNSDLAGTLNNLAILYKDLRKFESAEEHYKEALKIYRALAERNPDAFDSDLAMTLNNLANLYNDLRKFEYGEEHYKEALKIYRALAERNPDAFNSYLAATLDNLANLYKDLRKFEYGEVHYKEALKIKKALAERNPDAFNSYLAGTLNNLADLYKDLRKFESAEEYYKEALKIYRTLAERNPDAFNPYLAGTLNSYGNLYRELKRFEEANKFHNEAFKLYHRMAKESPDAFEHFLVRIKADIARLYIDSGKGKEGITCLSDCLKRSDLLRDLGAESFAALGEAQERLQNAKEAAENYMLAASTYFILFKKGVRCLDEVKKDLKKAKELGDSKTKRDAEIMFIAVQRLEGEEADIAEVELSERGMALRDALKGTAYSEFKPENVIDEMILILIKDLSALQIIAEKNP